MKKNESNAFNMFKAVLVALNSFPTVWNSNATINAVVVVAFQNLIGGLITNDQGQKTGTKGATQTKAQAMDALVTLAVAVADAGYAYAVSVSNMQLKQTCSINKTKLTKAKDVDVIAICQNVHDAVNPFVANLTGYGVTSGTITAYQNTINTFSLLTGQPANAKAVVKVATQNIAQEVSAGKKMLNDQLDLLMTQYKLSNTQFYNQYFGARVINDLAGRKTVILKGGVYTAQHAAINGAEIKLSGNAVKTKFIGLDGLYKLTRLHVGTYTLTVSANGFVTQTKTIVVTKNGTLDTDFVMVASGGGTNTNNNGPVIAQ